MNIPYTLVPTALYVAGMLGVFYGVMTCYYMVPDVRLAFMEVVGPICYRLGLSEVGGVAVVGVIISMFWIVVLPYMYYLLIKSFISK